MFGLLGAEALTNLAINETDSLIDGSSEYQV